MPDRPTAVIVYLSGHHRGQTHRLHGDRLRVGTGDDFEIHVLPHELPPGFAERTGESGVLAELVLRDGTYDLEVAPGAQVWVNGRLASETDPVALDSGDVVEIEEGGPVLRFRLYRPGSTSWKSMSEAFSDCRDCARHGGSNALTRAGIMLAGTPVELATQTAPSVRISLLLMLVLFVGFLGSMWTRSLLLEDRLAEESARIEGLAGLVDRTEKTSFSAEDFATARDSLEERLSDALVRVEALETRLGSRPRIISEAARSVVFLQGAYGFVETKSGRALRLMPAKDGKRPLGVTLEGDGPHVEILYTGTAFVATAEGLLLTNRHVAVPWEFDAPARELVGSGFEPVMRRFRGFLPGMVEPFDVELVAADDVADVAVLRCDLRTGEVPPLDLSERTLEAGEEIVVLGYPTGMQALLARTDPAFVETLMNDGAIDFWELAMRLSAGGHIAPLATAGVVGQVTTGSVVYDAETTHGGSGGPVLDLDGKVVAVNAAVIPEFGGSNLGVPAGRAARLLAVEPGQAAAPGEDPS